MRVGCIDQDLCLLCPPRRHWIGPVAATAASISKHDSDDNLDLALGRPAIRDGTHKASAYSRSPNMSPFMIYPSSIREHIGYNV